MADDPVTLGELARDINALTASVNTGISGLQDQLRDMQRQAVEDRRHNADTYVRKDVNDGSLRELRDDITELKDNWKAQKGRNQQIVIGVVVGFIVLIIGMVATALGMPGGTV